MGIDGPKERATFSIDSAVKAALDGRIPKSKRSAFVEKAIEQALDEQARQEALAAIREFEPYPLKGPNAVETLRQARHQRDTELTAQNTRKAS